MSVDELYQEVILDHSRRPRNFGRLAAPDRTASGDNPLCGDRIDLDVRLADGRVEEIGFDGAGCAISTASASLMTEAVKGRPLAEVDALSRRFHDLLTTDRPAAAAAAAEELGKLAAFGGVREYPMRVKCATLPWHTLRAALAAGGITVTTETEPTETDR
jgi:nitrogen fixation NifU-like protein